MSNKNARAAVEVTAVLFDFNAANVPNYGKRREKNPVALIAKFY